LLIGAGPHAKKVYLPALRGDARASIVAVAELDANAGATRALVGESVDVVTTPPFAGPCLPAMWSSTLDAVVRRLRVDTVIIATEPLSHEAYLDWAIASGLHVLVDKPIIAYPDVSNDPDASRRLLRSFRGLRDRASARPDVLVAVAVQRRYHPGFEAVREALVDASARFGCPVTAFSSTHADGQFRHPTELRDEAYHGFKQGYGKLFHSGFHVVDLQAWLLASAAEAAGVAYTGMTATSSAARPDSFLRQVPRETYERQWGVRAWRLACPSSDEELRDQMRGYGELDLAALCTFHSDGVPMTLSQITLLHNSFSRRSWLRSRPDLYKSNGRVKHEHHNIVVGPFMTVQVHSYQASDRHETNDRSDYSIGGNNHFTVNLFRNTDWWDGDRPAFETIEISDLAEQRRLSAAGLITNHAKSAMLDEFLDCAGGRRPVDEHRSRLADHQFGATLLSAIAESSAAGRSVTSALPADPSTREAA